MGTVLECDDVAAATASRIFSLFRMRWRVRKLLISNLFSSRMNTGPSDGRSNIDSLLVSIFSDEVELDVVDVDVDVESDVDGLLKAETLSCVCGSDVTVSSSEILVESSGPFVANGSFAMFNRVDKITGFSSGRP